MRASAAREMASAAPVTSPRRAARQSAIVRFVAAICSVSALEP